MSSGFRFPSIRKSILVALSLLILGAYAVHNAASEPDGISGYSKVGCAGCHGPLSKTTIVKIYTDSTQIVAGHTYVFQISVANPNESAAGCDISVDNGAKLAVNGSNSGLKILGKDLTHDEPLGFTDDSAVWTFKYTAPVKAGIAHIFAAGNAVDADGGLSDTTSYFVNVVAASGPSITAPALLRDTVLRGDTVQTSFWVKNTGNATLTIDHYGLKFGKAFSIANSSTGNIAVGDSAPVTVQLFGGTLKSYTDTLHIYSNDELTPISSTALIGLVDSGNFHLSANPTNFGKITIGQSDTMTVTISNTGNGLLSIEQVSLSFANPDFTLISKPVYLPYNLAPKGSVSWAFAFMPSVVGVDSSSIPLSISEYEGNLIDTSIVLTGTGIQNAFVNPESASDISISISPNPSQGIFNLSSSGMTGTAQIEVSDPAGRIVAQEEITLGSESKINLSALPDGKYFLSIKSKDGQSFIRRIVVQR